MALDYPPYVYLAQVADHCPKAVSTYMLLWREMDGDNQIRIRKDEVRAEYLISLAKFRHDLLLLVKEGLVSINETPQKISIEIVGWDKAEEMHDAC